MQNKVNGSIVIYGNPREQVERVIDSFFADSCSNKLYIIDNYINDSAKEWFSDPRIEYIKCDNVGYGAGHNIGIRKSLEEVTYHVVLNPDIYFEKNVLSALTHFMNERSTAGLVMPKVVYPNGEIQYVCKLLPTPLNWIFRRFTPSKKILDRMNYQFELQKFEYKHIINVPYLSGCFMFLRTDIFYEVDGFDEKIFMHTEDTDLTRRIHEKYETMYFPSVSIVHEHQKESHKSFKMLWIHIKSTLYYFNKWGWFFDSQRKEMNNKALNQQINNGGHDGIGFDR